MRIRLLLIFLIPVVMQGQVMLRVTSVKPNVKNFGTVLQYFDGTISGTVLVDKSGNGYDAEIISMDFTATMGIPYKSACYLQQRIANYGKLNDSTHFWFNTATHEANLIPVTSLFQDIDYNHATFCRHQAQITDPVTLVETSEPAVIEIVNYSAALNGSGLRAAQAYFGVPYEAVTHVSWVDPDNGDDSWDGSKTRTSGNVGPWKTLLKANTSDSIGDTCYVKTGTLTAGGTTLNMALTFQSVGHSVFTSQSSTGTILAFRANIVFTGFEINGTNIASAAGNSLITMYSGCSGASINRCRFNNFTGTVRSLYYSASTYSGTSINNCVFVQFNTDDVVYLANSLIIATGNYFNYTTASGSKYCLWGIAGGTFSYNKFYNCTASRTLYLTPTNNVTTVFNNSFLKYDKITNDIFIDQINSTFPVNITYNSFILQSNSYCIRNESGNTNANAVLTIDHNTITSSPASPANADPVLISNHSSTIISNNTITSSNTTGAQIAVYSTINSMVGIQVINNNITTTSPGGYGIRVGMDDSDASDYNITGAIITGNHLVGARTNNNESVTMHGIMLGYLKNFTCKDNCADRMGYGVVDEGTYSDGDTSEVSGNLITRCIVGISSDGVRNHKYYNNTIYSDHTTGDFEGIVVAYNPTGPSIYPNSDNEVKNNFVCFNASNPSAYCVSMDSYSYSNTFDNNSYYNPTTSNMAKYNYTPTTFEQWQELGYDAYSTFQSYSLISYTPCAAVSRTILNTFRQAGVNVTYNWNTSGTTRNQGNPWPIGGYIK